MMAQIVDYTALAVLIAAVPSALWSAWRHRRPAGEGDLSPLWPPFLAVTLALLISYYTAIDQERAALQLLTWLAYLAVWYTARRSPRRRVMAVLRGLGWIVATVCLVEVVISGGRAGAWLQGNPNKTGGLLAVLIPLAGGYPWLLAGGAALLATGSRGAVSGVLASVVASVAPGRTRTKDVERVLIFALVVALAGLALWGMYRPSTIVSRLNTWHEALTLFLDRPLTGWGAGCYPHLAINEPLHPHADSWPLTVAAEQGLIGLAAWGWLSLVVARLALRSESRARLGLLAFAVHNLVDCTLWWWWIGISVMMCLSLLEESDD